VTWALEGTLTKSMLRSVCMAAWDRGSAACGCIVNNTWGENRRRRSFCLLWEAGTYLMRGVKRREEAQEVLIAAIHHRILGYAVRRHEYLYRAINIVSTQTCSAAHRLRCTLHFLSM